MNKFLLLLFILVLAISLPLFFTIKESITSRGKKDGFSNFNLEGNNDDTSSSLSDLLVKDIYPPTGKLGISNATANDTWREKPVFQLGSYEQITNNIRYPYNPDDGSCTPISMCNALYNNKNIGSNISHPLPQINPNCGTRICYFDTNNSFLPFRNDMQNILY